MNDIPVLQVSGRSIAYAWEQSLLSLYNFGCKIPTEYDKPGDPLSLDATMIITVLEPLSEPMIHLGIFGGFEDLEEYTMEVCEGIKDHLIRDKNNPNDKRWSYTYSDRLFNYGDDVIRINQIAVICAQLAQCEYTRRAQAITWIPCEDLFSEHPPCFCAGSLVRTPNGLQKIERLKNNDEVYAYDLNQNDFVVNKVKNFFKQEKQCIELFIIGNIRLCACEDQLINTLTGWQKVKDCDNTDSVLISTVCSGYELSLSMLAGFFHGDGWLSSNKNRKRNDICFSIHPNASDLWIKEWISQNSNNNINIEEKFIKSNMIPKGGRSKKIRISDLQLYNKLVKLGFPVGKKNGLIKWNAKTDKDYKDFLTGIFSAEGCIYFSDEAPHISIGMMWKECIDFVSNILIKFNIPHHYYCNNQNVHLLTINKTSDIIKCFKLFDFRLDSRKQAKWLLIKASYQQSINDLKLRKKHIDKLKKLKKNGYTISQLRKLKPFNNRTLITNYEPKFRWKLLDRVLLMNQALWLPIYKSVPIGSKTVYDFEIQHKDHAIIVNNIISHNCLQRLHFRIYDNKLNMNCSIRSNDAYKANMFNMYAFVRLQEKIAQEVSRLSSREIGVGRYCHMADSYHIYGKDIKDFEKRFLNAIEKRTFEQRTARYEDVKDIMEEARPKILMKVRLWKKRK